MGTMMIDAKWHGLVQEKLTLAKAAFNEVDERSEDLFLIDQEALRQGGVLLLEEARALLLQHIARTYQHKNPVIRDLDGLKALLGEDHAECAQLEALQEKQHSWWQELDAWLSFYRRPRPQKARPQNDSIIAVAQEEGPDLSAENRTRVVQEMRQFLVEFSERHGEW